MTTRYEKVYSSETERLREAFDGAVARILNLRQILNKDASISPYTDGSDRQDINHFGGFGGFDRRTWELVRQDSRTVYFFEHVDRIKEKWGTDFKDNGTFGLAVSYPTLKNFSNVEIRDGYIAAKQADDRHSYGYQLQPRAKAGRLVLYPDMVRYHNSGIYIGSLDLENLREADITIDQIILATDALEIFYTARYFKELTEI